MREGAKRDISIRSRQIPAGRRHRIAAGATSRLDGAQMAFANARRLDPSSWGATLALGEVKRLQGDYTTADPH
jgi:hypothetical protein